MNRFSLLGALARSGFVAIVAALLSPGSALWAQPPAGYYATATGLTGTLLREALHEVINDHTVIPYSSGGFDAHDAIDILQEDPLNPSNVLLIYSGYSVPKSSWPGYNREHLWPQSLGSVSGTPAHSDLHALYGCDANVNSQRSNKYFDDCLGGCSTPAEAPDCRYDADVWEPRDADKGDVARAILYMDVRYEGDVAGEPDLVLGDLFPSVGCDCMASLATLLAWHAMDPPDVPEQDRNDLIYSLMQSNRNPFVDHPEWVDAVWGAAPPPPPPPPPGSGFWINEFHYDNSGADTGEGIEIAGPAGTGLTGAQLVLYNGATLTPYNTINLGGTIPDEGSGWGARWFPATGLQNGPDGIALVSSTGAVLEFLAYESSFVPTSGPATGLSPQLLPVVESGSTAVGQSLQRVGTGSSSSDFNFVGPTAASPGFTNTGQTFSVTAIPFVRGDCSDDGGISIADALVVLSYLFSGGAVDCLAACDAGGDGQILLDDPLRILDYLFTSGPPPVTPFPSCGVPALPGATCGNFLACP